MIRDKGVQLAPTEPGVVAVLRSEPGALQTKGGVFAFQKQEIKQQDESLMWRGPVNPSAAGEKHHLQRYDLPGLLTDGFCSSNVQWNCFGCPLLPRGRSVSLFSSLDVLHAWEICWVKRGSLSAEILQELVSLPQKQSK